ncbi:Stage III sporulation protein E [uncultured Blautia sp.]|uniref:FtsK/SpoIIIE family DNA translocase n=1 Tax=Blautia acetigignens TaxID=2981783 RepID=UPI0008217B4A|nr:DNA translocase FtsK [Blautia acetigignens]MCU6774416.1 DNA translocase FtsK 4TM domain-containing protein [Blautia acetigignens]SCH41592.1 Stage III sporulation protein E [uncultured Blautia sp.]
MAASKTQKSNTRKKSTAKGNVSGKKKTAGRPSTRKNVNTKQSISSGFQTEIVILVLIAASIILMVSCLGFGGSVGGSISRALMGVMGLMAYAFPFVLFGVSVFLISNKGNVLAYKKTAAAAVLFLVLCGVFQLLTEGYAESTTLAEYYKVSSQYHTGGGAIGGAICISTISAFGTVGAYVIIVLVILVCLILITQHSFLGFLYKLYDKLLEMLKGTHERYQEGAPERELRRQVKAQQRQMAAQERRERRMKELEAALAEEDLDLEEEELESEDGSKKTSSIFGKKKQKNRDSLTEASQPVRRQARRGAEAETTGFLVGTDLFSDMEAYGDGMDDQVSLPEDTGLDFAIHRSETVDTEEVLPETVMEEQQQLAHFGEEMQPQAVNPVQDAEDEDSYAGVDFKEAMATARTMQATSAGGSGTGADVSGSHGSGGAASTSGSSGTADGSHGVASAGEERASRQPAKNPKSSRQEIESGIVNIQHEISTQEAAVKREYQYPSVNLLKRGNGKSQGDSDAHLRKTAQKLQEILYNFGVNAKVTNVSCGPTVTRYELQPEMGVKVSKIVGLADDIKLNLAAPDIRIEAPIPGKAAVGIEVPNKEHSAVMLRDLIQSPEFQNAKSKLAFAAGKDIEGKTVVADIAKMPHLLIAGSTGSGKSVCINTLIISILYKAKPDEVKLIMIDPKVVELSVYNGIPHLFIPVVTDPKKAAGALNWAVNEMSNRYNTFAEYGVRNLEEFNRKLDKMTFPEGEQRPEKMCQIVIIVDELADLMMVAPGDVEDAICRLAQLARAAGIHLVIATQRPSVNVITGLIKANMPSRIAFAVTSGVDSRTILDMNGAEKLLGKGDMLFYPQGYQKPARLQGAFVSDDEVSDIVNFLADKNPRTDYDSKIEQQMNNAVLTAGGSSGGEERDVYFEQAGKFIIEKEKASIGMLQRMYKIGFNRAARIMDQLCDAGVVGPEEGTKPRKVLMSMEEFQTYVEEHL